MRARREFRDRRGIEVDVLDALVDRGGKGMTVFEVRAAVDTDIDDIEAALAALKQDDLISVEGGDDRVVIMADDRVIPDPEVDHHEERGFLDTIRDRFGL